MINRREQILAKEEKRPVRRLSSFDYLIGIEDFSRIGAFRFKESINGDYINASEILRIPPLTDIRELIAASSLYVAYRISPLGISNTGIL